MKLYSYSQILQFRRQTVVDLISTCRWNDYCILLCLKGVGLFPPSPPKKKPQPCSSHYCEMRNYQQRCTRAVHTFGIKGSQPVTFQSDRVRPFKVDVLISCWIVWRSWVWTRGLCLWHRGTCWTPCSWRRPWQRWVVTPPAGLPSCQRAPCNKKKRQMSYWERNKRLNIKICKRVMCNFQPLGKWPLMAWCKKYMARIAGT